MAAWMTFMLVVFILFDGVFSYKSTQNALIRRQQLIKNNQFLNNGHRQQACPCNHRRDANEAECPCSSSDDGDYYTLQHKKRHHVRRKHKTNKPYYSALAMDTDTDTDTNTDSSHNGTHSHGLNGYSNKLQSTAFLFSLFLGEIGIDRFYVDDYVFGLIKLGLFILIITGPFVFICCFSSAERGAEEGSFHLVCSGLSFGCLATVLWICACITLIVWIVCDITRFALNDISDAYGLTLIPM